MSKKLVLVLCMGLALSAGAALGQTVTPVAATASSTFFSYTLPALIDDSGLSGGLHDEEYTNMWMSDYGDVQPVLTFDLGAVYNLSAARIWQYNATCCGLVRGVQSFSISVSNDNVSFTPAGSGTLTQSPGGTIPAQVVPCFGAGRYVRFTVVSNHGDGAYTGLSEVKFDTAGIQAVPALSPSALAALALLLALAGAVAVRRLA